MFHRYIVCAVIIGKYYFDQKGLKNMKKKSIIILALMIVLSILLNYFVFFGINIAGFKYDSLFGTDLFGKNETALTDTTSADTTDGENKENADAAATGEETATDETTADETADQADAAAADTTDETAADSADTTAADDSTAAADTTAAAAADTGRIRKGIDLAGGSVISFEADASTFPEGKTSATEEDMDTSAGSRLYRGKNQQRRARSDYR